MADEEVRLTASMNDDLSAALERIERRLNEVERQLIETAAAGKAMGKAVDDGAKEAEDGLEDLGDEAERTKEKVRAAGDETEKTGNKARRAATGFDVFGNSLKKAGRRGSAFGSIITAFKIGGIVTGVFALAGGISALGAGAAIAVGGLAPMFGVLGGLPPLFLAAKLSALAFKLAAEQLSGPLTRMKDQFTTLGQEIADGGLGQGLDYLASSMFGFSGAVGRGLAGLGGVIGDGARALGDLISSGPFLDQLAELFSGLNPIVASVIRGLLALAPALLGFFNAALPLAQEMADSFRDGAQAFSRWLTVQNESGRTTRSLLSAWDLFRRVMGVLVDLLAGVVNVLRIAGRYADEMGLSIEAAAYRFRLWTESAEGQARINQYFRDSLPALREMGRLLGMLLGGLASLGANQNVAPLLAQIRTELAPAIGELVNNLAGQGGLGPALISTAASIASLLAGLDFTGLTTFIQALGALATALLWLTQNVPGANFVISALLFSMLGFKALGPVFSIVGSGAQAFGWVWTAARGVQGLSKSQQMLKGVLWMVSAGITAMGTAFKTMALAGIGALRALSIALFTTPVGWIILAIMAVIAVIILLWNKCEWFRDAVTAVWEWIKKAAGVAWEWIKIAVSAVIDAIIWYITTYRDIVLTVWNWIASAAVVVWNAIAGFVQGAVSVIADIAMWLWTNAIQPIWNLIVTVWEVNWAVIKFIVQTVIFIIAAIIAGLAWVAEKAWEGIAAGAKWVFENVILPVVNFFRDTWNSVTSWVSEKWEWLTTAMSLAWSLFYDTYIKPVIDTFRAAWEGISNRVSEKWTWLTTAMSLAWQLFYDTYIRPVIDGFRAAWEILTTGASAAWEKFTSWISERWNEFSGLVGSVVDGISTKWSEFTSWLGELFAPVGRGISAVWEGIQTAASKAADVVKGAWETVKDAIKAVWNFIANGWNNIPSVTVPDWVPGMGGKTFSLPKLPTLWHGGETPGGPALVGEHGPEPLVRGGRVVGMLGMGGPEVVNLPTGGYVVPNLKTLAAMPGLARRLPASVAAAVAASVPGYSAPRIVGGDNAGLTAAVRELTAAVREQRPPVAVAGGGDVEARVAAALRTLRREDEVRRQYSYEAGRG